MALVSLPYAYIPNPVSDRSLFNGRIYIGQPDATDVINNPKSVTIVQEDGTRIPAQQPISIGSGGVPTLNGAPVALDVEGQYSILILNRSGGQSYFSSNSGATADNSATDLRAFARDLNLPFDSINVVIATSAEGQLLDDALYLLDLTSGLGYELPSGIPAGATVVSVNGSTLVTSAGQFTMRTNPQKGFSSLTVATILRTNSSYKITADAGFALPTSPNDGDFVRIYSNSNSENRIITSASSNILVPGGTLTNQVPLSFGMVEALFVWNGQTSQWEFVSTNAILDEFLTGAPIPWMSTTVPAWALKPTGQAFDPVAFPLLASRYPTNTLPDLRSEFIRGLDDGRGVDENRVILSAQDFQIGEHTHLVLDTTRNPGGSPTGAAVQTATETPVADGAESRPRNVAFMYIVRAA